MGIDCKSNRTNLFHSLSLSLKISLHLFLSRFLPLVPLRTFPLDQFTFVQIDSCFKFFSHNMFKLNLSIVVTFLFFSSYFSLPIFPLMFSFSLSFFLSFLFVERKMSSLVFHQFWFFKFPKRDLLSRKKILLDVRNRTLEGKKKLRRERERTDEKE